MSQSIFLVVLWTLGHGGVTISNSVHGAGSASVSNNVIGAGSHSVSNDIDGQETIHTGTGDYSGVVSNCGVDKNQSCASWKSEGYCNTSVAEHVAYMKENCAASCCGSESDSDEVSLDQSQNAAATAQQQDCGVDKNQSCAYWKSQGSCTIHVDYMKENCAASCCAYAQQQVTTVAPAAQQQACGVDKNQSCAYWKSQGSCNSASDVAYMKANCAATCCANGANGANGANVSNNVNGGGTFTVTNTINGVTTTSTGNGNHYSGFNNGVHYNYNGGYNIRR